MGKNHTQKTKSTKKYFLGNYLAEKPNKANFNLQLLVILQLFCYFELHILVDCKNYFMIS